MANESYINVASQRNTKAIGDGPRSLEPRSSNEDDTSAGICSPNWRTLSTTDFTCISLLYTVGHQWRQNSNP
ncbi:hypothetical protein TNCV_4496891 [Trichonephila clavipes]|nr:hypothetical protein TNCV_4496891 [Trichonephila clavipes]